MRFLDCMTDGGKQPTCRDYVWKGNAWTPTLPFSMTYGHESNTLYLLNRRYRCGWGECKRAETVLD